MVHRHWIFNNGSFLWAQMQRLLRKPPRLGYVDHAEELASRFLQCFPKNRLSAQAALNNEYFSNLPPRLCELHDMSSIFTVPNVKLQTESGDSIQVCARRNSHGKASSGSKH